MDAQLWLEQTWLGRGKEAAGVAWLTSRGFGSPGVAAEQRIRYKLMAHSLHDASFVSRTSCFQLIIILQSRG